MWDIGYLPKVHKDLEKLDQTIQYRITRFLDDRVAVRSDPRSLGESLKGPTLGNYWKYRVGNYRIVVDIRDAHKLLVVMDVGDRKDVYR